MRISFPSQPLVDIEAWTAAIFMLSCGERCRIFCCVGWMVNLEEVHLDRRVEESLVGRCHGTGLDFLHGDDDLAFGGH